MQNEKTKIDKIPSTETSGVVDKKSIIAAYADLLSQKTQNLKQEVASLQQRTREAPTSAETHSDTSRMQLGELALTTEARLHAIEKQSVDAQLMTERKSEKIEIGTLFRIKNLKSGEEATYFVVPTEGGDELNVKGTLVTCVSMTAPLVKEFLVIKQGQTIDFRNQKYQLIEVE